MKIFVDTASIKEIEDLAQWGIIEGLQRTPLFSQRRG